MLYLDSSPDLSIGKKILSVELKEGSNFAELLKELADKYGPELVKEIYDPQKSTLHEMVRALVNGSLVHNLNDMDTVLKQGDNIVFVPLIMGG